MAYEFSDDLKIKLRGSKRQRVLKFIFTANNRVRNYFLIGLATTLIIIWTS